VNKEGTDSVRFYLSISLKISNKTHKEPWALARAAGQARASVPVLFEFLSHQRDRRCDDIFDRRQRASLCRLGRGDGALGRTHAFGAKGCDPLIMS